MNHKLELTPAVKRILDYAQLEARRSREKYVSTQHLMVGAAMEGNCIASQLLKTAGITVDIIRMSPIPPVEKEVK